ncbi:hypothetical protein F52700_1329 [Fusarium sp. NRRL 52700]|nr:hypothetical protein F52700_1329 [Fusarium sp. NRRL 52700]
MFQTSVLLMPAKYMVKGRNFNTLEQEGELETPQQGTCSRQDPTVQKREPSKTSTRKKRSTGFAGHPNDEDDPNESDRDGDISRKRKSQDQHGLSTINAETEKRLRSRKTTKSSTEEEKWFNMYHIIFPGHLPPTSPYHSDTEDLAKIFKRSIGPRLQHDLQEAIEKAIESAFADSIPISTMVDNITHQTMAAVTSVLLNNRDIDGKDSETSQDSLPAATFFDEFYPRTAVPNCSEAVSSNPKNLPNELESLPQSMNEAAVTNSTAADSCRTDWLSATSRPQKDSNSGIKRSSSPLGSGQDIDLVNASGLVPRLNSENQAFEHALMADPFTDLSNFPPFPEG